MNIVQASAPAQPHQAIWYEPARGVATQCRRHSRAKQSISKPESQLPLQGASPGLGPWPLSPAPRLTITISHHRDHVRLLNSCLAAEATRPVTIVAGLAAKSSLSCALTYGTYRLPIHP